MQQQTSEIAIASDLISAQNKLATLQAKREALSKSPSNVDDSKIDDVDGKILQAENEQGELMSQEKIYQDFKARGTVLQKLLKYEMEDKVMKKAAFWQCILTILTYIIFALNTVITGFGLANVANQNGNSTTGI